MTTPPTAPFHTGAVMAVPLGTWTLLNCGTRTACARSLDPTVMATGSAAASVKAEPEIVTRRMAQLPAPVPWTWRKRTSSSFWNPDVDLTCTVELPELAVVVISAKALTISLPDAVYAPSDPSPVLLTETGSSRVLERAPVALLPTLRATKPPFVLPEYTVVMFVSFFEIVIGMRSPKTYTVGELPKPVPIKENGSPSGMVDTSFPVASRTARRLGVALLWPVDFMASSSDATVDMLVDMLACSVVTAARVVDCDRMTVSLGSKGRQGWRQEKRVRCM